MAETRFFLARFLVEVDVTDRPDFDDRQAASYFSSVFSLTGNDRKREVTVHELRRKASYIRDVEIEEYEYRGFVIMVNQNAESVGAVVPTYFACVSRPDAKGGAVVADSDSEFIEVTKDAAQIYVDKRVSRRKQK